MKDILVCTELFYESGFNAAPWSNSNNPEFDQFYYHIKPIPESRNLLEEMTSALTGLLRRLPDLTIVDDNSLEAHVLMKIAPTAKTIPIDLDHEPTAEFIELCLSKYQIHDHEMIFALSWAKQIKKPLLFSKWQMRILNVNFLRTKNQALGNPYYVYVENERYHRLKLAQKGLNISFSWNFLNSSPAIFRSFFFHPVTQSWLAGNGATEAHNFDSEREILHTLNGGIGAPKVPWQLGPWCKNLKNSHPVQQASFPLHVLFEKIFQHKSTLNSDARALYGF